ncbi:MAG: hypothetical protein ACYDAD_04900 [Acidimicrobiales bacterium]
MTATARLPPTAEHVSAPADPRPDPDALAFVGLRIRWTWWLAAVLAVAGLSGAVTFASLPGPELLRRFLADDAFYYFGLADHFPHAEFTRHLTTTGFHPLWWLILAPAGRLLGTWGMVRFALAALLGAHLASGWGLFVLVRRRFSAGVGAVTGAAWAASPHLRALSLQGVEAALAMLGVVSLLVLCDASRPLGARRALAIGFTLGITYLARTDSFIVTVPVVCWYAWGRREMGWRVLGRRLLRAAAVSLAVALPWLIFLVAQGSLRGQDSGAALGTLRASLGISRADAFSTVVRHVGATLGQAFLPHTSQGLAQAFAVFLGLCGFVACRASAAGRSWAREHAALGWGTLALLTAYAWLLRGTRPWYHLYAALAFFVMLAPPVLERIRLWARPRRVVGLAIIGTAAGLFLAAHFDVAQNPQELDKFHAVAAAVPLLRQGDRLAAFNAGIYGYFLPGGVLNIDGVVNGGARRALQTRTLCGYLNEHGVTAVIDTRSAMVGLDIFGPGLRVEPPVPLVGRGAGRPSVSQDQVLVRIDTRECRQR